MVFSTGTSPWKYGRSFPECRACKRAGRLFSLGVAALVVVLLALVVLLLAWAMGDRPGRTS
jgi:hypothetical protein